VQNLIWKLYLCFRAGPGSYNVQPATPRIWRRPPAFSFGLRHSAFAGNMLTARDQEENAVPTADDCS